LSSVPSPWIHAEALRVDVAGSPVLDGVTFATTGRSVAILGAPRALFEACAAERAPTSGSLRIVGHTPDEASRRALVAVAPLDPPLPPAWTTRSYATWSARLVGHDRASAERNAREAIAMLRMGGIADAKLGGAPVHIRRGAVLAAALATGASLLLFEDPTPGLADDVARTLARVLAQALDETATSPGRAWVMFAARLPLTSPFAHRADEAFLFSRGQLARSGAPGELAAAEQTFHVRVNGPQNDFVDVLRKHGADVVTADTHLTVRLDDALAPRELFQLAEEAHVVLVELVPIADTFT
jgi:ABC-type multidrug transport system ATPase subunit